jgi:hypothetical protein
MLKNKKTDLNVMRYSIETRGDLQYATFFALRHLNVVNSIVYCISTQRNPLFTYNSRTIYRRVSNVLRFILD